MKIEKHEQFKEHLSEKFYQCFIELEQKVQEKAFTAWSFANNEGCLSGFWLDECMVSNEKAEAGCLHPLFDLSSLTKPFFINLYLRLLWKNDTDFFKNITTPIAQLYRNADGAKKYHAKNDLFYSFFTKKENEKFTLDSFLSHTSGAKNWFWMGSSLYGKASILENLKRSSLGYIGKDFGKTVYSDINYFILAQILEGISGEHFSWNNVLQFLNFQLKTHFFHASLEPQKTKGAIPFYPYVLCRSLNSTSSHRLKGNGVPSLVVHDPNANFLATQEDKNNIVSGHAGFFGDIIDVVLATFALSKNQNALLKNLPCDYKIADGFVFGLDRPSLPHSQSGVIHWQENKNFVYGHLGYTGTSFWFFNDAKETENTQYHILLTNRTAQRKMRQRDGSALESPRLFVYTDFKTNYNRFFLQSENKFSSISFFEAKTLMKSFFENSEKKRDGAVLRDVPNMSDIRRNIAYKLWNI